SNTVYDQQFYLPADSSYINLSRSFFRTSIILGDTSNFMVPHKKQITQAVASKKTDVMTGHLLDENKQALPMMRIQLLNDKDSVIATTLTDNTGYFTFDKLKADGNYILKVEATDSKLNRHFKDVYLADKDGRVVREYDTKKKDTYIFKHLPVDLTSLQLIAVDDNKLTADAKKAQEAAKYSKDTASMPKSDADFTRYFAYNVDKINVNDADFKTLVDKIAAKASGQVTLTISGSASKVPTHAFLHSNKTLAHRREKETQDAIEKALKAKNIDTSKLAITVDFSIQGPAYEGDAADQVKYEKFQYVKVYVR
ncbi:MAG TPA: carboxypeptidase-like regulatory domain-containing protein, partial [Bacteroidia bacterium]|nr:carboxypeptidase-like regulatory domain-containing protein [Bacteroidia bacterium]